MSDLNSLVDEIIASKKYSFLYVPLVERICKEEFPKYKKNKDRIKAIKSKLHILYGAYLGGGCHLAANQLLDKYEASDIKDIKKISESIMRLHSSTNERLNHLSELYEYIFGNIGETISVMDIGCGFNPFSLPWLLEYGVSIYFAYDIDYRTSSLLSRYFNILGMKQAAANIDVISESPSETVDAAFLFKIIPLLEAQKTGRGFQLINEINSKYIVITYPLKSLSGKEKGMRNTYSDTFEKSLDKNYNIRSKKIINNELIYIVSKLN